MPKKETMVDKKYIDSLIYQLILLKEITNNTK
jgi:hypothetical protein